MASVLQGTKSPFEEQFGDGNATVTITVGDQRTKLTTAQMENAIWWLGAIRAAIVPQEPLESLPENRVPLTPVTNWRVAPFNPNQPCDILLRTIQFGWVAMRLIPESRHALIATLTGADRIAPPGMQKH